MNGDKPIVLTENKHVVLTVGGLIAVAAALVWVGAQLQSLKVTMQSFDDHKAIDWIYTDQAMFVSQLEAKHPELRLPDIRNIHKTVHNTRNPNE